MRPLHIHGIGTCAMGAEEEYTSGTGRMEDVPIKGYAKPAARRRYGRVTRLVYIAAARALEDAGIEDPSTVSVISSTAMGEVKTSLDLLTQIHETRGSPISPSLVPNSVHNAPAGHLTIGIKNRQPSVTVSQGWLSCEAALAAASDLLHSGVSPLALVVVGDEADPEWIERLEKSGAPGWASDLGEQHFQEGGVALVVGLEPGGKGLGSIEAAVERGDEERVTEITAKHGTNSEIRLRTGAGSERLSVAEGLSSASVDGPGVGTSQIGAMAVLIDRMKDTSCNELLLLGMEVDDLGWLHWKRG